MLTDPQLSARKKERGNIETCLHNVSETEVSNGVDHMICPVIRARNEHFMNDFASSRLNLFNFLRKRRNHDFLNYAEQ